MFMYRITNVYIQISFYKGNAMKKQTESDDLILTCGGNFKLQKLQFE